MKSYFASNLKVLRKDLGLSQRELAEALGKKKSIISNYESGVTTPGLKVLNHISRFFGMSYKELLERDLEGERLLIGNIQLSESDDGNPQISGRYAALVSSYEVDIKKLLQSKKKGLSKLTKEGLRSRLDETIKILDLLVDEITELRKKNKHLSNQKEKLAQVLGRFAV